MGPATFVVTLIIGLCLVVGALALGSARRSRKSTARCESCGRKNPPKASFCAGCGHELQKDDT